MAAETIKILHVSDLHLIDNNDPNCTRIIDRFCDYISGEDNPFTHVLFTGDLMRKNDVNIDDIVITINRIVTSSGVTGREYVYIIPGESDADNAGNNLISQIGKTYKIGNDTTFNSTSNLLNRFNSFRNICDRFYGTINLWNTTDLHAFHNIDGVAFICLNSCFFRTSDNLDNNLFFGIDYVEKLLAKTDDAQTVIILSHHPWEMIAPKDRDWFYARITQLKHKKCYWFCGHLHTCKKYESLPGINVFQAGTLTGYERSAQFSCYNICDNGEIRWKKCFYKSDLGYLANGKDGWKANIITLP